MHSTTSCGRHVHPPARQHNRVPDTRQAFCHIPGNWMHLAIRCQWDSGQWMAPVEAPFAYAWARLGIRKPRRRLARSLGCRTRRERPSNAFLAMGLGRAAAVLADVKPTAGWRAKREVSRSCDVHLVYWFWFRGRSGGVMAPRRSVPRLSAVDIIPLKVSRRFRGNTVTDT